MESHPLGSEVDHVIACGPQSTAGACPPPLWATGSVPVRATAVGCGTAYAELLWGHSLLFTPKFPFPSLSLITI